MTRPDPQAAEVGAAEQLPTGVTDSVLIHACVAGDQRAWESLVRRYERLVYAIARKLGLSNELASDVAQEVFTILVRQLPGLQHQQALPKWLMTTTRRVALRMAQRQRRHAPTNLDAMPDLAALTPSEGFGDLERLELTHRLDVAMEELSARCRDLLVALTRQDGSSYAHISAQLGMPAGSIGPTRARCLAKLLELMRENSV